MFFNITFEQILIYAGPPLLGAFIGYITNYIAIRMLFRPLRPWRIFGVRLPLTPGIIPAKRGELAEKMGDMVGSHLLTSEDVGRALEKENFRRELKSSMSDRIGQFLDRDLGPLVSLAPPEFRERFVELIELLRWKVVKAVFEYLDSPEFEKKLRDYLEHKGNELLAKDLANFLTPQRYQMLRMHFDERLSTFLRSPGVARSVAAFVDNKTEQWVTSQRSLREMLPAGLIEVVLSQIEKEAPPLLEKLGGMLYDPDFRGRLVKKAHEAIENFLDSLGGLSAILAGFFDMEKLYERIPEFLDKAGEELSRWLREERTQAQVSTAIRERLDVFFDRPIASFFEKVPYEKVAGMRRFIRERVVATVQGRRAADGLLALAERGVDRIKDRSFGSLLQRLLPEGGIAQGREMLADRLLAALRAPAAREALEKILAEKLDRWLFRKPLGRLSARLPADVREELEAAVFVQLTELLKKEGPPLVETLNIRKIVEDKVNSLDIIKVEGLLMGIMREQFKYINLFGALLGFLIGLANLVFLRLP